MIRASYEMAVLWLLKHLGNMVSQPHLGNKRSDAVFMCDVLLFRRRGILSLPMFRWLKEQMRPVHINPPYGFHEHTDAPCGEGLEQKCPGRRGSQSRDVPGLTSCSYLCEDTMLWASAERLLPTLISSNHTECNESSKGKQLPFQPVECLFIAGLAKKNLELFIGNLHITE